MSLENMGQASPGYTKVRLDVLEGTYYTDVRNDIYDAIRHQTAIEYKARIAELEKALAPFAALVQHRLDILSESAIWSWPEEVRDTWPVYVTKDGVITLGDLRRAKAVLGEEP